MAARLGATVKMLGKVGNDDFGDDYLRQLKEEKVDTSGVERESTTCTGIAQITVSGSGENCIVVVPGANGAVDIDYCQSVLEPHILGSKVLLCQVST
jgi:ribokinase